MSDTAFLVIMLAVIVVVFAVSVPSLVRKKCPACGSRNGLDAARCAKCGFEFPAD